MYKHFFLLLIFFSVSVKAQITDTVMVIPPLDTLNTDTLSAADSLALADTTGLLSDSLNIKRTEILEPLYQNPLYAYSSFIDNKDFYRRPYAFTGDIFEITPFFFNVSHGLAGYPDNLITYGTGASLTSFLVNGISYNDYSGIPLDLNRISSEYIDSLEVIPLPRGFLYGVSNNISAVNFIGKDFLSVVPYSRIRYFEGPFAEGFFDGIFNSVVLNRFNLFFEVTNRKADRRYINTDFSSWNARIQLKYHLNNNLNFITGYEYASTMTGVSGGVDVMSLPENDLSFFENIYDEITAPVIYRTYRFNTYTNQLYLKTLASTGKYSFTDLSFYYRFNRIELNQPQNDSLYLDNLIKNKISGITLNQNLKYSLFSLKVLASLESGRLTERLGFSNNLLYNDPVMTNMSLAGIFSTALFDSVFTPSVFYKINRVKLIDTDEYTGYGADLAVSLPGYVTFYSGYSESERKYINGRSKNFQVRLDYGSENFKAGAGYFSRKADINIGTADSVLNLNSSYYYPANVSGINLNLDILISKFLLEGKAEYYRQGNKDLTDIIPSSVFSGGLYFKDSLFSGNLDLKTGLNFYYYGKRNLNLGSDYFLIYRGNTAGPDVRLDFFLSGEIQGSAIIFFQWENLLDTKYFLVPFYPLPPRGIRFGVSWEIFN